MIAKTDLFSYQLTGGVYRCILGRRLLRVSIMVLGQVIQPIGDITDGNGWFEHLGIDPDRRFSIMEPKRIVSNHDESM